MKVNLGCGRLPLAGFHNVDLVAVEADELADVFLLDDTHWQDLELIRMDHLLEHVGYTAGQELLRKCRCWLGDDMLLEVEVPDMAAIWERGLFPGWEAYWYGCQEHGGEFHLAGYTAETLRGALEYRGFLVDRVDVFLSDNPNRPGMPCVRAVARA